MKKNLLECCYSLGVLGLLPLAVSSCSKNKEEDKPNIIFFLVDDLGWSDLGCYGSSYYETPNVDRFAREGVRFTSAYSACHVSSPTRASILTGKYPATLHLTDWLPGRPDSPSQMLTVPPFNQHLPYGEITLAEALKDFGYTTGIYGKWHLGDDPSTPLAHGFDIRVPEGEFGRRYYAPFDIKGLACKEGDYLTDRLTDEALAFIDNNKERPFFLYLSHFAVHNPLEGRKDLVEKYREKLERTPVMETLPYVLEGNPDDPDPVTPEEAAILLRDKEYEGFYDLPNRMIKIKQHQDNEVYAAMVESMDKSFGRVLSRVKELGLDDNTIIIFFSDNGGRANGTSTNTSTSNLPLRGGKGWLYEGGIRVPLIVKWPEHGKTGHECDESVISIDFYPTILEMTGCPLPEEQEIEGVSLVPLLKGKRNLARAAIYWHFPHYSNHGRQSPGGAIRKGDLKLIEYYENNTVQLFNIKEDIGEQHDISGSNPETVNELRTMLHTWRESVNAQMMGKNPDYGSGL
jgi:arylsulfatase A-like enzyme